MARPRRQNGCPRHAGQTLRLLSTGTLWGLLFWSSGAQAESPKTRGLASHAETSTRPLDTAHVDSKPTSPDTGSAGMRNSGPWPSRPILNLAFGFGETLYYDIGWQSVVAGTGRMVVLPPVDTSKHLCFPIVSTVASSAFFSTFYRVDDSAISFMDVRELYPLRFEKYLREGKYRAEQIADFDPMTGNAYTPKDTIPIPPYVQDALSLLYYVRALELEPGADITVENFTGKKNYTLTVKILHRERIEVKAGIFSTVVVEPLLQAAGLFKQEGKLKVWLTDDRLHLPVLMKTKVLVGSIVAELTDYRLGTIRRYGP